jgi:hypothetical protein
MPPRESAFARALDPAGADWGTTEELLALLIEVTDHSNRLTHAGWGQQQPAPLRIPRPTDPPKAKAEPGATERYFLGGGGRGVYVPPRKD